MYEESDGVIVNPAAKRPARKVATRRFAIPFDFWAGENRSSSAQSFIEIGIEMNEAAGPCPGIPAFRARRRCYCGNFSRGDVCALMAPFGL
jgi:hypothetical protein